MEYSTDTIETLQLRNEALEMKIEALMMKIEALQLKNQHMLETHEILQSFGDRIPQLPGQKGPSRFVTAKLSKLRDPLQGAVEKVLEGTGGSYNRATYRAITGVLLCLWENGKANVNLIHEYIGGSRVTIVRHTTMLKKLGMLVYEGSRKKGNYVLTEKGKKFVADIAAKAGA
jgi:predicted transcriptional regulator